MSAAVAGAYVGYRANPREARPAAVAPAAPAAALLAPAAPPPAPAAADAGADAREAELAALKDAEENLTAENEKLRGHLNDLLNWILVNFRGRYPMPESMMGRVAMPAVADDFTVHAELAEFLKISPEEQDRLNAAFASARDMLQQAEAGVMKAESPTPNSAVVDIPPFEAEGETVRQTLVSAFEQALGAARSERLQQVAAADLDRQFSDFGKVHRTLRFELVYADGSGEPLLKVRDERVRAGQDGRRRIEATEFESRDVPEEYRFYLSRLPRGEGET